MASPSPHLSLRVKRVYDPPTADDGARILVDRIWPHGLSREKAALDLWLKEIAPSTELRKWFGHKVELWDEFRQRYTAELDSNPAAVTILREKIAVSPVTLLYAARDEKHNQALVLQDYMRTTGM